jgi:hypothetical protein
MLTTTQRDLKQLKTSVFKKKLSRGDRSMSIIRKVKSTEEYKKRLASLPQCTRNNKIDVVNKFQKFCDEKR